MVVHLWVEDFLELFTTVMVAYIFVLLGVVREKIALRVIFLDIVLYSAGGVIGTAHHWYFNGEPAAVLGLGAFFSAFEVIPLTFLTVEAWSFIRLGARQEARSSTAFPHRWAVMFLVAVGFWNFVGAGIFGFLINLPIVSYYEIGTNLTANHAHAAMMGVYGMLAAWMVFVTLLPSGILQLYHSVDVGYYDARTLTYIGNRTNTLLEWLRLPGDVLFIAGGVAPLLWVAIQGVLHHGRHEGLPEDDELHLFTEIEHLEPAEASAAGTLTDGS